MIFDAYAALRKLNSEATTPATSATSATSTPENLPRVAQVARVACVEGSKPENAEPDLDAYEERAAIMEYDANLSRAEAEARAAQAQGFGDVIDFMAAVARLREAERAPAMSNTMETIPPDPRPETVTGPSRPGPYRN